MPFQNHTTLQPCNIFFLNLCNDRAMTWSVNTGNSRGASSPFCRESAISYSSCLKHRAYCSSNSWPIYTPLASALANRSPIRWEREKEGERDKVKLKVSCQTALETLSQYSGLTESWVSFGRGTAELFLHLARLVNWKMVMLSSSIMTLVPSTSQGAEQFQRCFYWRTPVKQSSLLPIVFYAHPLTPPGLSLVQSGGH